MSLSLGTVLALLLGGLQGAPAQEGGPRPVKTVEAKTEQSAQPRFAGVVRARVESDLGFRTLGRVLSRKVDVGDFVREGEVLAELDPLALQFAVTSAQADLSNADARLRNAELTETRKRTLAAHDASSVADLDIAEQGLKSARANVAKAQASLDKAREQLGYARLKAEFDGVVTATLVETGQTVTTGQSVLTLARLGQRDVVVDIPERYLDILPLGSKLDIALQLDETLRAPGILREIGPEADADTRTHRLKIAIDDAPEVFRLGSIVTATILSDQPGRTITLPVSAIIESGGVNSVWVIDPQKHTISQRRVQLAAQPADDRDIRIASGLAEGETVVAAGVRELTDGQKVEIEMGSNP